MDGELEIRPHGLVIASGFFFFLLGGVTAAGAIATSTPPLYAFAAVFAGFAVATMRLGVRVERAAIIVRNFVTTTRVSRAEVSEVEVGRLGTTTLGLLLRLRDGRRVKLWAAMDWRPVPFGRPSRWLREQHARLAGALRADA